MFRKSLSFLTLVALAALTACADITGPEKTGFCPITGGPGTCVEPGVTAHK